ncbi:Transcription factor GRAS [Dillenia turbinata]|uniref:Transcription factor GRAS n=1 Tax=Dillenia turbinata TaxID=194707 RepID=A0AAN8WFT6_9MAGN
MLGSFNSSNEEEEACPSSDLHFLPHQITTTPPPTHTLSHSPGTSTTRISSFPTSALHMRQLLISCADLISRSDFAAAHRLLSVLSGNSSPFGDSTERLVHAFTKALSLRLNRHTPTTTTPPPFITNPMSSTNSGSNIEEEVQSSYLSLNQITPFIRFSQLTANQAILEAIEQGQQQAIHILDFDIMHGVQWPPFMQAIADRQPPPFLRITGTGQDTELLRRTGDRLRRFAESLGLNFEFNPVLLLSNDPHALNDLFLPSALQLLPEETLAVNCVLFLHRLLRDDDDDHHDSRGRGRELLRVFLHKIKTMNPKVVTVAEREANHNHRVYMRRFVEALDHYTAIFDSLEATLPPHSRERMNVESVWFGREIVDILAGEGEERIERHERFESWQVMLRSCGFSNVPLSPFALSQAKLLLRLHYPSEGYQLQILNNSCCFLGWQNHPLFSVSSWH